MLRIRQEQVDVLTRKARRRELEKALFAHALRVWPEAAEEMGPTALRSRVKRTVEKAETYRIRQTKDVARFLNLVFLWGDDFEDSPELAGAREILESPDMSGRTKVYRLSFRAHKEIEEGKLGVPGTGSER